VIHGPTGRNFAAGMSGGIAYVLDGKGQLAGRCNTELVGFDEIDATDAIELHALIEEHHLRTLSPVAARILDGWEGWLPRFVKVMPHDYKRALADMAAAEDAMRADDERDAVADAVGVPHTGTSRQS